MTDYSQYLIIEDPLVVLPTIARALDINKAIILQQVQYWLRKSKHERDGHRWIWNSYREWSEQFTWLTPRAIRHHIKELERLGLLVAGEYNKDTRDKTKWYRIDYAAVDDLVTKAAHGLSSGGTPYAVEGMMQEPLEVVALPETTPETTTKEDNNSRPKEFDEYEKNLGILLVPIVAEGIKVKLEECPEGWVSEAIEVAAKADVRNWRYVARILDNWLANGKTADPPGMKRKGPQARTSIEGAYPGKYDDLPRPAFIRCIEDGIDGSPLRIAINSGRVPGDILSWPVEKREAYVEAIASGAPSDKL